VLELNIASGDSIIALGLLYVSFSPPRYFLAYGASLTSLLLLLYFIISGRWRCWM